MGPDERGSMGFKELKDPALQERLKAARTPEEVLAIAKDEGFELTDDELEGVAGGEFWCPVVCNDDNDCYDY